MSNKNIKVNEKNKDGSNALMIAALIGRDKIAQMLLDNGADPEIKGKMGETALLLSSDRGHKRIVDILLKKGARPNVMDKFGQTPLVFAMRNGYNEIANVLKKKGGKLNLFQTLFYQNLLRDLSRILKDSSLNRNEIIIGLIAGIISSIVASVLFFISLKSFKPKIKISPFISYKLRNSNKVYALKIINKSKSPAINIKYQLPSVHP